MRRLVIGTAGHIDHGKSALVRALTGIEPDRLKEEQQRGITIDLGFAHAEMNGVAVAIVDVPGHERFIRNMLAGATGIDAVLLVIAADESVMPQTREHLDICRLLDVRAGVIALTKTDVAEPALREVSREEARELVAGSFLAHAPIVEVSAATGEGLDELKRELAALATRVPERIAHGPARLPIDRAFTLKGFGTVVTGTLVSGSMATDDELVLLPAGRPTRVRGLHVHGTAVSRAQAGQRVAANLNDVQVQDIARGDTLVTPGCFEAVRRLDVRLDLLPSARRLRHGARVRFHQGTSEVMARVSVAQIVGGDRETETSIQGRSAGVVPAGARAYVRARLESPIVAARGDRFVLRSYSPMTTIAGGIVLDSFPRRGSVRTETARARFLALDPGAEDAGEAAALGRACVVLVAEYGRDGVTVPRLALRLATTAARLDDIIRANVAKGRLLQVGDVLIDRNVFDQLAALLTGLVEQHHRDVPDSEGMPREEVRDRLRVAAPVLDALVGELSRAGRLVGRERLALSGRRAAFADHDRAAMSALESIVRDCGLKPLDVPELAARSGLGPGKVERMLALLVREKRVVRLGGLPFHREALDGLVTQVRAMAGTTGQQPGDVRLEVAAFKTRFDLSRKFAIPLLEFLDRERVTRRVGDARVVL
jgi:selenocysteine-specific elongation factor